VAGVDPIGAAADPKGVDGPEEAKALPDGAVTPKGLALELVPKGGAGAGDEELAPNGAAGFTKDKPKFPKVLDEVDVAGG
jgi:hypothetical protein